MRTRVSLMCSLVLTATLASCAPGMTGVSGPAARTAPASVRPGIAAYFYPRVALADLSDETPDETSVVLPGCVNAVVPARDVRRLGPEQATAQCVSASNTGIAVAIGIAVAGILVVIYLLVQVLHALGPNPPTTQGTP